MVDSSTLGLLVCDLTVRNATKTPSGRMGSSGSSNGMCVVVMAAGSSLSSAWKKRSAVLWWCRWARFGACGGGLRDTTSATSSISTIRPGINIDNPGKIGDFYDLGRSIGVGRSCDIHPQSWMWRYFCKAFFSSVYCISSPR